MRARALAVHMCMRLPARAGQPATADPALGHTEAAPQSGKCCVADKKQTDKQTNTHYSFIGIDKLHFT